MEWTRRQQEIIETAIGIIADEGIHRLTVRRIAESLHITDPAIYRHFESKRSILEGIVDLFHEKVIHIHNSMNAHSLQGLERVKMLIYHRLRLFSENPKLTHVMMSEANFRHEAGIADRVLGIMHSHRNQVLEALQEAQDLGQVRRDVPTRHLFTMIIGSVRLLTTQWLLGGCHHDLVQDGEALWSTIYRLLRG